MAARDNTSGDQFGNPADVPPDYGSTPIPPGMVRFNHYTRSEEAARSIQRNGLLRSKSEESFARGGTESPQVFATAGTPTDDFKRSNVYVEGYANPARGGQLDVGENWQGFDPAEHAQRLASHRSVITAKGDIPSSQILHVHEPWHETYRYVQRDPGMEHGVMHGDYDVTGDTQADKAIATTKTALAAKVMLGGSLGGKRLGGH